MLIITNNKSDSNVRVQYVIHKYIACFTLAVFDLEKLQILTVNVHHFKVIIHNNCCLFNELYFFKGQNSTRRQSNYRRCCDINIYFVLIWNNKTFFSTGLYLL